MPTRERSASKSDAEAESLRADPRPHIHRSSTLNAAPSRNQPTDAILTNDIESFAPGAET